MMHMESHDKKMELTVHQQYHMMMRGDIVDVLHDDDVSTVGYEHKEDMNEILDKFSTISGTNDVKYNY